MRPAPEPGSDPGQHGQVLTEQRRWNAASIASFVAVAGVALFTLLQLSPSLLVANTTPAGGDMGAHVWGPAFMRDHLLPQGRLTGWTHDWYAGFPALVFYFPIPSLLIVLLDLFLPYGIAFKLVSVSGVVTLPIAAWAMGRLLAMPRPGPPILGAASILFLFDRSFTIYGGNIPSTLAGEFAFSISLSLALVFIGLVGKGLRTGQHRALTPVVLALTGLCHVIPTFFALAAAFVLLVMHVGVDAVRENSRAILTRGRWWISSMAVGGAIASFWVLPFLARLPYTNDMGWEKIEGDAAWDALLPKVAPNDLRWLVAAAGASGVVSIGLRRRTGIFLTIMALLSGAAFMLAPQSRLWNARLLPFWFLCLYLLVGVLVAEIGRGLGLLVKGREQRDLVDRSLPVIVAPIAAALAAVVFVGLPLQALPSWVPVSKPNDVSFIPGWVNWNYSGYERKASYGEYRDVVTTMDGIGQRRGCGRAMWEYEPQLDRMGTPMALMLLPYWTDGCIGSMEGLFFESSASTPYHFLNQSELSQVPSRAQRDLPYRPLDLVNGVQHLQLMGVRYYMAISPEAQQQARGHEDLTLIGTAGPWPVNYPSGTQDRTWEIYEVADAEIVAPLESEPVVMDGVAKGGHPWLEAAVDFYQDPSRWDAPLAASGPSQWRRVRGADPNPPRRALPEVEVSDIEMGEDSISFTVDRVGVPVLVKSSYFPNWTASGADGPWRVTPNQMVVIPTSKEVKLEYKATPVDWFSWLITFAGIATVIVLARRPALVHPEPPAPPPAPDFWEHGPDGAPDGSLDAHAGLDDDDELVSATVAAAPPGPTFVDPPPPAERSERDASPEA